jgi:hypothetical protein
LNSSLHQRLSELEQQLSLITHSDTAVEVLRGFMADLGKNTASRQTVLNLPGVLLQPPITLEAAYEKGYSATADAFTVLQGDIITTESAYLLGQRRVGGQRFLVLTPTCDLMPSRRTYAMLLPLLPIYADENAKGILNALTMFKRRDGMYIPPLPGDLDQEAPILAYMAAFDGLFGIYNTDIQQSHRLASLSIVGWRIFCSMIHGVLTRTGEEELQIRRAFR